MARKQIMVESPASAGTLGSSDKATLQKMFPGSPVVRGELDDSVAERRFYRDEDADGWMDDGGHTFGRVNRNYAEAPDISAVVVGGGGLPGNPHAPNIASPAAGQNPADIPEAGVEATTAAKGAGGAFGNGENVNPSTTSTNIGRQTVGSLHLGRSGA